MIIGISGKKQHGKDTLALIIEFIVDQYKDHGQILQKFDKFKAYWATQVLLNVEGYKYHYERKQFAYKLKQIVCLLIGCTMGQLEDNEFKEKLLGEKWRRFSYYHYKLSSDISDGRVSPYFSTIEELMLYEFPKVNDRPLWGREALSVRNELLTPRLLLQLIGTEGLRNTVHPNVHVNALFADYIGINTGKKEYIGHGDYTEVSTIEYPNWIITDTRFPNEAKAIKDREGLIFRIFNPRVKSNDTHPSEIALDSYQEFDEFITNDGSIEDLIEKTRVILQKYKII